MPIVFSAPEGTEIFLFSELGGEFVNQMSYIKITANKEGVATTWWLSRGDGVAACNIIYRSPEYPAKGFITPYVKSLELMDLETISPVVKQITKKVPVQP